MLFEVALAILAAASYLRWWRVAQLEHYAPGRVSAIASLWTRVRTVNWFLLALVLVAVALGFLHLAFVLVAMVVAELVPVGLRSDRLARTIVSTWRLKRLVAVTLALHAIVASVLILVGGISLLPLVILPVAEVALVLVTPIERVLGRSWQVAAADKIRRVGPRVVAITGSYGKTSTKNYAAHLLSGRWSVLASPASFNNVMGLSRAVNDRLLPGTDVFVAEMGTYGPGEIARLCEVFPPEVSAITTIGEAHLERMKDRATIVRAKSEILGPARTVVLNVDVPELAQKANELDGTKAVIRCSTDVAGSADVIIAPQGDSWVLALRGTRHEIALPTDVDHPINVAIAVGVALALDVPEQIVLERLSSVPATPHRAETSKTVDGLVIIDDTYNANPDGAAAAIARARQLAGATGRVWTITPGMVELGREQARRNAELAETATGAPNMYLCIVGRTNRAALRNGVPDRTTEFAGREAAKEHVMAHAQAGDVVLYENDLPDHYP